MPDGEHQELICRARKVEEYLKAEEALSGSSTPDIHAVQI